MILEYLSSINASNKMEAFLLEKAMLDISIENADKIKNKDAFLKDNYRVEEKFDGTKLSLWRNGDAWTEDYEKNWVIAFKNQILYGGEFETLDRKKIKKYSVGISQYAFIHDHMKSIHKDTKSFPKNTEVFVEFIQNKITTTRDYENKHGFYIIAYSPAKGEVEGGMLKTKPTGFFQDKVTKYSKMLNLNLPPVVFEGKLDSVGNITTGILNPKLKKAWDNHKNEYDDNPYETIKTVFLEFESVLGGKTEGVVLHSDSGKIYKFLQADQHSTEVRWSKKEKYTLTDTSEQIKYWNLITEFSKHILKTMDYDFNKLEYKDILTEYSKIVNNLTEEEMTVFLNILSPLMN